MAGGVCFNALSTFKHDVVVSSTQTHVRGSHLERETVLQLTGISLAVMTAELATVGKAATRSRCHWRWMLRAVSP